MDRGDLALYFQNVDQVKEILFAEGVARLDYSLVGIQELSLCLVNLLIGFLIRCQIYFPDCESLQKRIVHLGLLSVHSDSFLLS